MIKLLSMVGFTGYLEAVEIQANGPSVEASLTLNDTQVTSLIDRLAAMLALRGER